MNTRAYALARRWTVTVLSAGALGAAALGVHLAQAQTVATTASGATQQAPQVPRQALKQRPSRLREGDDDGAAAGQQSGGQGSFQQVIPPGAGGVGGGQQAGTSGS